MSKLLIAEKSAVIVFRDKDGKKLQRKIRAGKLYRSDDPLVRGRERMFSEVEDTMAEPGTKRSLPTRSRKAKSESKADSATPSGAESKAAESDAKTSDE